MFCESDNRTSPSWVIVYVSPSRLSSCVFYRTSDAITGALARLSFNRTISGTRWTALTRHWCFTDVLAMRGAFNQLPFKFHTAPNSLHQYPALSTRPIQLGTVRIYHRHLLHFRGDYSPLLVGSPSQRLSLLCVYRADIKPINKPPRRMHAETPRGFNSATKRICQKSRSGTAGKRFSSLSILPTSSP